MTHGIKDSLHDSQNNIFLIEEEAIMGTSELEEQIKISGSNQGSRPGSRQTSFSVSPTLSRRRSSLVLEEHSTADDAEPDVKAKKAETKIKTISDIKAFVLEASKMSFLTDSYLIEESEDLEAKTNEESLKKADSNQVH